MREDQKILGEIFWKKNRLLGNLWKKKSADETLEETRRKAFLDQCLKDIRLLEYTLEEYLLKALFSFPRESLT